MHRLLIIWLDGSKDYIDNVDHYGVNSKGIYYIEKGSTRSFVNPGATRYFGEYKSWADK